MATVTWELLQQVFTVETLMTPRQDLLVWQRGTDQHAVRAEAEERGFDVVPIAERERIVGVLPLKATEPEPLTDRWLVSHDTGIPDLIALFARIECPVLLVFSRQDTIGLVAPADLNRLPARAYLYNLVGELELALARLIEQCYADDPAQALLALSEKRRRTLEESERDLSAGNASVNPVQMLYLSDLIDIVTTQNVLRSRLGFTSKHAAKKSLGGLVDLRNQVMHLVRPVLESVPEDLQKLQERIERAHNLLERAEAQS